MVKIKVKFVLAGIMCAAFIISMTAHADEKAQQQKAPVSITKAISKHILVTEGAVGRIEAKIAPIVSAEEPGVVTDVLVDAGQHVNKGDILTKLDNEAQRLAEDALQSEVERLEALIVNQKRTVKRYGNLLKKKSIPQERFDNAEVKLATLKEQLAGAKANLLNSKRKKAKTEAIAPVSGWIEKRFVSAGDFVDIGTPLFQIVTDQKLRVVLPFPESIALKFKKGQKVRLVAPITPEVTIDSEISELRPAINSNNRAIELIVNIDNPGYWRPGASINGIVIIGEKQNAILVPDGSIVRRPDGEVVYIIKNNMAKQRKVITGIRIGNFIEIKEGVSVGETIAVNGAGYLTDNTPVHVQETK